jgi:hypothetical protein
VSTYLTHGVILERVYRQYEEELKVIQVKGNKNTATGRKLNICDNIVGNYGY